jgi:FkbM family methyltransferase
MNATSGLTWSERIALKLRPAEFSVLWKKIACVKRREVVARGMRFWVDPVSDFGVRIINDGDYESVFSNYLLGLLQPGMTFCDVGSNEGVFSVWASRAVGNNGRVICLEPQQRLWPVILRNMRINCCVNFVLFPYAVGEQNADFEMELFPSTNTGATSLVAGLSKRRREKQPVTVLPLADILEHQNLICVDIMKIDIEGFELFALLGLRDWFNPTRVKNILIEMHPRQ